jgi:hypothetical protein
MYTRIYIYIYHPIRPSACLHTKNTSIRGPVPHLGTKIGSLAYEQKDTSYIHQGASISPPPAPPS